MTESESDREVGCSILQLAVALGVCCVRSIVAICMFQLSNESAKCGDYSRAVENYVLLSSFSILWWFSQHRAGTFALALVITGTPCYLYSSCIANDWAMFLQVDFPLNCVFATYYILNRVYVLWFKRPIISIPHQPLLNRKHQSQGQMFVSEV